MAKKVKKPASEKGGQKKKKFPVKKLIAAIVAVAVIAAVVVFLVIKTNEDNAKRVLRNTTWVSKTATDASGDEVDVRQVYNSKYTNYQGTLRFGESDDKFELWLTPGEASDGTHSGTYELKEDKITAKFDEGTEAEFKVHRKDGKITQIDVYYDEYVVGFYPQ